MFLGSLVDNCLGILKGHIKKGVRVAGVFIYKNSTAEHLLGTRRTPGPWQRRCVSKTEAGVAEWPLMSELVPTHTTP